MTYLAVLWPQSQFGQRTRRLPDSPPPPLLHLGQMQCSSRCVQLTRIATYSSSFASVQVGLLKSILFTYSTVSRMLSIVRSMLSRSWPRLHLQPSRAPMTRTLPVLSFSYSESRCLPRSSHTVPVLPVLPFGFAFNRFHSLCLFAVHQPSQLERVSP